MSTFLKQTLNNIVKPSWCIHVALTLHKQNKKTFSRLRKSEAMGVTLVSFKIQIH